MLIQCMKEVQFHRTVFICLSMDPLYFSTNDIYFTLQNTRLCCHCCNSPHLAYTVIIMQIALSFFHSLGDEQMLTLLDALDASYSFASQVCSN